MPEKDQFDGLARNEAEVRKALAQLPGFNGKDTTIQWLSGGGAHKNFLVVSAGRQIVLKLWNTMWEGVGAIPPAPVVMQNTILAGEIGIGAPVLSIISDPLALAIEFLPFCTPLDPTGDRWLPRLASTARSLHDSRIHFNNDYNAFAEARKMFASARQRGAAMPADFETLRREVRKIEQVLDLRVNDFVPCHNDLYRPNILETPSGDLRLIDYDLSGNGDRCYELGFAAEYFEMDVDTIGRFCEAYFGEHNPRMLARTQLFAVACNWSSIALWTVAMSMAGTNDDYDYHGEMTSSLRRLHANLESDDLGTRMKDAAR